LEAARQKLYERVVNSTDPDTAREAYEAMLKEETKLKELELESRKAAALEEGVRLQRLRIEVMAAGGGRGGNSRDRTQRAQRNGMVIEAGPVIAGELAGPGEKDFTKGNKGNEEKENGTGANGVKGEEMAKLREFFDRLGSILNRGGRPEEKLLEARRRRRWERREQGEAAEREVLFEDGNRMLREL
jgi:hypothetical protein